MKSADEAEPTLPLSRRDGAGTANTSDASPEQDVPTPIQNLLEDGYSENDRLCDDQEIFVPIHGFVRFTEEEIAVINHPAFQRLGEIYQLGQAHLVYRGGTHKRLEHSLGTVHVAEQMMNAVADNHARLQRSGRHAGLPLCEALSKQERVFIRLAALLHDIGHLPAGHTLEDELNLIPQHDQIARLNLVLDRDDWPGSEAPSLRDVIDTKFAKFLRGQKIKPADLIIQIIAKKEELPKIELPATFRLRVCRDIVGNTICADLFDYLHRDWYHIGRPKYYEQRLLQYMEIRESVEKEPTFVISLGERPRLKTDAISAILDLLESRYQLAESVLFHRAKCSAAAMLERAVQELTESTPGKERPSWVAGLPKKLLEYSDLGVTKSFLRLADERKCESAARCLRSLLNRRIYKVIYTTFHSERAKSVAMKLQAIYSDAKDAPAKRLEAVRLLERNFNLPSGTVAIYCPTRGMNAKIADVEIHMDGVMQKFREWDEQEETLGGGHLGAQIVRFMRLWRVHVCLDRDQWNLMPDQVRILFYRAVKEVMLGISDFPVDQAAYDLALTASVTPKSPYFGKTVVGKAKAARREKVPHYPSGAPSIAAFFDGEG